MLDVFELCTQKAEHCERVSYATSSRVESQNEKKMQNVAGEQDENLMQSASETLERTGSSVPAATAKLGDAPKSMQRGSSGRTQS